MPSHVLPTGGELASNWSGFHVRSAQAAIPARSGSGRAETRMSELGGLLGS